MTWWQWALTIAGAWSAISIVVAGLSGLVIRAFRRGQQHDQEASDVQSPKRSNSDVGHRSAPEEPGADERLARASVASPSTRHR